MKKQRQTLLWKIEGKKATENSYVFGTMHVKDRRAFRFKDEVEKSILECQAYAAEFNLEEATHNLSSDSMDLPVGQTLDQIIPPKKYKKIRKVFLKSTGLDIDFFKYSKPMLVTNMLSEAILSSDMPDSLDIHLWKFAKENGKITLGIETVAEQLEIMNKIPLDYQIKSLVSAGKNFSKFRKQILKLTTQYENGNLQQLYKTSKKGLGSIRKVMLYDRNFLMADRIDKIIKEQSTFIAIGAGHLAGKKGVLRLLKHAGNVVKPIFHSVE